MKLIVGLGNPGPEYRMTRHNFGFWVADRIGTTSGAHFSARKDLFCDLARLEIQGQPVLLAKPTTYMNLSGKAVRAVVSWYKIAQADMLVMHDDVSLPLGRMRFQKNGGAGGQHGIESIIEEFGGRKDFDRLKLGTGPDPGGSMRAGYVLSAIPEADRPLVERCVEMARQAVLFWVERGTEQAANQFNGLHLDILPSVDGI